MTKRKKEKKEKMPSYLKASLAFLESEEMQDYLLKELPGDYNMQRYCTQIVAYAPAPIERKLPVLEQIARENGPAPDGRDFWKNDAARFVQSCRTALEERYSTPAGAMFHLQDYRYSKNGPLFDHAYFTDFDAALSCPQKQDPEFFEDTSLEGLSYSITKYIPNGQGQLTEHCTWYLNGSLELWYFDYGDDWPGKYRDREPLFDYLGDSPNLPVPFQPGDIVSVDCLPYAKPRRVLILEVGDNRDCCCLQALSIRKKGRMEMGALKHNDFLRGKEHSHISGLYRARRWNGELPAREYPFAFLSPLIHARPALGQEIWDYMYARESPYLKGEGASRKDCMPTLEELKAAFAL